MFVVWLVALRLRNAGIVDIAWAGSFLLLAGLYAATGGGALEVVTLMAITTGLWSLRLATFLYWRVMGHHPVEDTRYQELRRNWAPHADRRFFWFFQAQALAAVFFSLPFALMALEPRPGLRATHWVGLALWVVAIAGESLADWQLSRFKADPAHRGQTCQAGLWRYSRHPNYFFEWLVWCGFAVMALPSPFGWLALACPAAMLYLLFRVTGIPATEQAALRSRGDAYREYQRTTSAFVPWFRKST
jgi:steroid 5-alpha reductase family enzyme